MMDACKVYCPLGDSGDRNDGAKNTEYNADSHFGGNWHIAGCVAVYDRYECENIVRLSVG